MATILIAYDIHPTKGEGSIKSRRYNLLVIGGITSNQLGLCDALTHRAKYEIN
jgi:hypothetical protein